MNGVVGVDRFVGRGGVRAGLALLALVGALGLGSCRPRTQTTAQTLRFAVAGTYDRSADLRERSEERLRKSTTWISDPPLAAERLSVTYDVDQRGLSWRVDVVGSALSVRQLTEAGDLRELGRSGGARVLAVAGGPFDGTLVLERPGTVSVVSRPYVVHYLPELLRLIS